MIATMHRKIDFLLTVLMLLSLPLSVAAQTTTTEIRYVSKNGTYANDGKTWATAKANIQDAINDLVDNNLKGEV